MNRIYLFFVVSFCLMLCSCYTLRYLPDPKNIPYSVNGAHVIASIPEMPDMEGELIAVTNDSIYFYRITYQQDYMAILAKSTVKHIMIQVSLTSDNPAAISTWGSLLWLTSIAHGSYGVITLPINLTVGLSIAGSATHSVFFIDYPDHIKWEEMKKFARFPQGIPTGINVAEIK